MSLRRPRKPIDPDKNSHTTDHFSGKRGATYEKFWDEVASTREGAYYGVAGLPFGEAPDDENLERHGKRTAGILLKKLNLGKTDAVLEVGVGVGRLARAIAPYVAEYHGTDISSNMIEYARSRCAELNNGFLYHVPDGSLGAFPSAKFDAVIFQVVLIHLDREDAFHYLEQARRLLKPDGKLWAQFYNLLHPGGWVQFRFAVEQGLKEGDKSRGRVQAYTHLEVRKFVEEAGFEINEELSHLEPHEQKFDFETPDSDWRYYLVAVASPKV